MAGDRFVLTVVPVLDEERYIERCLRSLIEQTWPADQHRIAILDGGCIDRTIRIVERLAVESRLASGPIVEVIENPGREVALARNMALQRAGDEVTHIFEMIGHAWLPPNHIEVRMADLAAHEERLGRSIGGIGTRVAMSDEQLSAQGQAVEHALTSRLGAGGGQFVQFRQAGPATVAAFCIHSIEAVRQVGGWDARWVTGQDHDINHRLVVAGWPVWRSPASYLHMAKRQTLSGLFRLGSRYGYWRTRQLLAHPGRASPKEFLPWLGAAITVVLAASGSTLWIIPPVLYLLALLFDSMPTAVAWRSPLLLFTRPLALLLLHTSFSAGLLWGLIGLPAPRNDRARR